MNKLLSTAIAGALIAVGNPAMAGGDAAAGKTKYATCQGCHGAQGISINPLWPSLAGQKSAYLVKQLKAFRKGTREDPVMSPMAKPLTDADVDNLAAYIESLKCK